MTLKYKGYRVTAEETNGVLTGTVFFTSSKKTKICGSTKSEFQRCFRHAVNSYLHNNVRKL